MNAPIAIGEVRDADGFAEIGSYGVIGDGRGIVLVARDGDVDWWGAPQIDSEPPFAALLDPAGGGRCSLRPTDPQAQTEHRYLPHTNQLETTFTTDSGVVRVLDSLNSGAAGPLPWTELARRVDGVRGSVEMTFVVAPGNGMKQWQPWAEHDDRGAVLHAGDLTMGVRCTDGIEVEVHRADVTARFTVEAEQRCVLAVVASLAEPLFLTDIDAVDARIDATTASWRHWSAQVDWSGEGREQIVRSALALKLLMVRTGAIAAAATTSLPEQIGGPKNWDYRYCWIRDAALTIDAMALCGLQEEVHSATSWLLRTIREHGPDLHVMYTLDGRLGKGTSRPDIPGYRDSRPVLVGNDAVDQLQLGTYGDLFQTVSRWVFSGHVLDVATARELADLADRCADEWMRRDAGIWELQHNEHYTSSKMNCWRALTRAAQLAESGHISGPVHRWQREAAAIRQWINEHCWSERKQAYTFYSHTDDLDASVLLGAQFNFDTGPRMSSTIDALRRELSAGPLLFRYSGVDQEEQTFLACAFWQVEALARVGRLDEAQQVMNELDAVTSDLGLLSEMATPGSYELVGNTPQALSHLAFISAAFTLRDRQQN